MALRATGRVPRPYGLKTHPALVKDDPYNIPPTITVGQRDVEWIFSRLTGRPEASEELDKAWSEVGEAQMRGLQDYWRTSLREELLGYAYRPLSDYGDTDEEATREDL